MNIARENKDINPMGHNPVASLWFKKFDQLYNTKGNYAMAEEGNKECCIGKYSLDYMNDDLKLIIEWDEFHHFYQGRLKDKDIERQKYIKELFPDYEFIRIKQWQKNREIFDLNRIRFNYYRTYRESFKKNLGVL